MNALVTPSVHEFINSTGMAFKVRAVSVQGNEWFVAKDVCDAIGLTTNPSAHIGHLGHMEKITLKPDYGGLDFSSMFPKGRGPRMMLIISEAGLYKLIMRCDKPDARPFQDWVTKVVLPAIRKDGAYVQGEEKVISGEMSEEELLLKAMTILNRKVERLAQERDELKAANVSLTPKASAYDLIFDQDGLVRLSEVQKAIRVRDTRINLNAMTPDLIRMGWLYREERDSKRATARA
ncbi:BRO family protein [Gluconobacter cerinus]|uniref:BRO-N domain-containing protein n=1 Tax=Gluconobacter cerinus TaxID=38307 RepID=UPI0030A6B28D